MLKTLKCLHIDVSLWHAATASGRHHAPHAPSTCRLPGLRALPSVTGRAASLGTNAKLNGEFEFEFEFVFEFDMKRTVVSLWHAATASGRHDALHVPSPCRPPGRGALTSAAGGAASPRNKREA